jgi:hypothetical protein
MRSFNVNCMGNRCPRGRCLYIEVIPSHRHQGVGGALFQRVLAAANEQAASGLLCSIGSDADTESLGFAERRGFRLAYQMVTCTLDLQRFDHGPWWGAVRNAEAGGIRFTSLEYAVDIDGTIRMLYDLDQAVSHDVPEWSGIMPPLEEYRANVLTADPTGIWVAPGPRDRPGAQAARHTMGAGAGRLRSAEL